MNKKILLGLAVIFAVSFLVYFGLHKCANRQCVLKPVQENQIPAVQKITVTKNNVPAVFIKKDSVWALSDDPSFKINTEVVTSAIDSLKNIEIKEVISENPENFSKFEVTPESGTIIAVTALINNKEKELLNVTVGKNAQNYNSFYAKFPNENKVYLIEGIEKYQFDNVRSAWRNKVVAKFNKDDVKTLSIVYNKKNYEITKPSATYYVNGKESTNQNSAYAVLSTFIDLQAYEFADAEVAKDPTKLGFDKNFMGITVTTPAETARIMVGAETPDKSKRYVMREGDPTVYLFNKTMFDNVANNVSKL